jgi:hypothetical protein
MKHPVSNKQSANLSRPALQLAVWLVVAALSLPALAGLTTAERITYQGRLLDNGTPFSGTVAMEFSLWTQASGGTEVATQTIESVEVANGLFQVQLFFGDRAYEDSLWIEVVADGTTLTPRQPITAVPLALHALNGGGGGFWELNGGVLGYDGVVSIGTNAAQDNLSVTGGLVVARDGASSHAAVEGASIGLGNASHWGVLGTNASRNGAGVRGLSEHPEGTGVEGLVFGGTEDTNYGVYGVSNSNQGYGIYARNIGDTGTALLAEGTFGIDVIADIVGVSANGGNAGLIASSPEIGVFGVAEDPGGFAGLFTGPAGSKNYFQRETGIGTDDPQAMLHIEDTTGDSFPNYLTITDGAETKFSVFSNGIVLGPGTVGSSLYLNNFVAGGQTSVCKQTATGNPEVGFLAQCSSSRRYKTDIEGIDSATSLVDQLRPVTFRWTESGEADYGFVAEEVAAVEPRLATYNADGQIEGVKYRQISAVLIRALQEQRQETLRLEEDFRVLRVQLEQSESLRAENQQLVERLERLEAVLLGEPALAGRD